MNRSRLLTSALLTVFMLPLYAGSPSTESTESIELQQGDQSDCVAKRVAHCVAKCDQTIDANCQNLCEETARNECRDAGE